MHKHELLIPPEVYSDKNAKELARIWAAHGRQYVSLSSKLWDDPMAWGIFLVDLANHAANIYELEDGRNRFEVLDRIKKGFEAEWENPTDIASGRILESD